MNSISALTELMSSMDSEQRAEAFLEIARLKAKVELIRSQIDRPLTGSELYWLSRGWAPPSLTTEVGSDE